MKENYYDPVEKGFVPAVTQMYHSIRCILKQFYITLGYLKAK
jgi:hypothetical protein